MMSAWVSGWCAGIGFMDLVLQNWAASLLCIGLAIVNGFIAYKNNK